MNKLFIVLGVLYLLFVNVELALSLTISLLVTIILAAISNVKKQDSSSLDDFPMELRREDENIKYFKTIIVSTILLFFVLTIAIYNIFSKVD